MVKKLDAIKIYEIAESGNTGQDHLRNIRNIFVNMNVR